MPAPKNSNKAVRRTVVSLRLPSVISVLVTFVQRILEAMTANPNFPTPNPPLTR